MAEIINLRRARKRAARDAASQDAAAARAKHGQTRRQREAVSADKDATRRLLDNAKLTPLPRNGEPAE